MARKLSEIMHRRQKFTRRNINSCTGYEVTNIKINNVMDNTSKLSENKIINKMGEGTNARDDSIAVLNAFGISVSHEVQDMDYTILGDANLDLFQIETLERTADKNPNRLQTEKFNTLNRRKIPASKIFNQKGAEQNKINQLDTCQPVETKSKTRTLPNVIEVTNDFLNSSEMTVLNMVTQR